MKRLSHAEGQGKPDAAIHCDVLLVAFWHDSLCGVYHYPDSDDAVHVVVDIFRVPKRYRGHIENAQSLPNVNVVGRAGPVAYNALT